MLVHPSRLASLLGLVVVLWCAAGLALAPAATASTSAVPYTDPGAKGSIGFCNQAGQEITHGTIGSTPFIWRAVSSQAAVAPYNEAGRTASLLIYQPRQGLDAGQWSGAAITAASRYTDAAHPMAAATARDESLQSFMKLYPPSWDGLYEVRMYLGAPDQPSETVTYAATDIKVTGSTWQVVQGASVPCASGTSVSIESILLPSTTPSTATSAAVTGGASAASTPGASSSSAAASAAAASGASASPSTTTLAAVSDASRSGSGGHTGLWIVTAIVTAALVVGGFLMTMRRSRTPDATQR